MRYDSEYTGESWRNELCTTRWECDARKLNGELILGQRNDVCVSPDKHEWKRFRAQCATHKAKRFASLQSVYTRVEWADFEYFEEDLLWTDIEIFQFHFKRFYPQYLFKKTSI